MTPKGTKELNAIDLLIEDLNVSHTDIRVTAKQLGCEHELDEWKAQVIEYLAIKRGEIL